jgi:hypothetical protein
MHTGNAICMFAGILIPGGGGDRLVLAKSIAAANIAPQLRVPPPLPQFTR